MRVVQFSLLDQIVIRGTWDLGQLQNGERFIQLVRLSYEIFHFRGHVVVRESRHEQREHRCRKLTVGQHHDHNSTPVAGTGNLQTGRFGVLTETIKPFSDQCVASMGRNVFFE